MNTMISKRHLLTSTAGVADCSAAYKKGVRQQMDSRLPPIVQPVIDWLTQKRTAAPPIVPEKSAAWEIGVDFGLIILLPLLIAATVMVGGWCLILSAYLILALVGRLRRLQSNVAHEAVHSTLLGRKPKHPKRQKELWLNQLIGETATAVVFATPLSIYSEVHLDHHDMDKFTTINDADAKFLHDEGFRPGKPIEYYYSLLLWKLVSPVFHARFFWSRVQANVARTRGWRRIAGVAAALALMGSLAVLPIPIWLFAVFLPWVPLYQASALVQFATEHENIQQTQGVETQAQYAARCWMRIPAHPVPEKNYHFGVEVINWLGWISVTLLWDLPIRLAVLPAELVHHDMHHLSWWSGDRTCDWPNQGLRREIIVHGTDPLRMGDREIWGFERALQHAFERLHRAKA